MVSRYAEFAARARRWVEVNACPLPVDLIAEILAAGFDAGKLEARCLQEMGVN